MARTKQTARRFGAPAHEMEPPDEEEQLEMNGHLTEEDKLRRAELEEAPMRAELVHLEKRWTKKGRAYICEPKDDDDLPEEKTDWFDKFALCVGFPSAVRPTPLTA